MRELKTRSEIAFFALFTAQGVRIDKIRESHEQKRPDFKITDDGYISYWEVKELPDNKVATDFDKEHNQNRSEAQIAKEISANGYSHSAFSIRSDRIDRGARSALKKFEEYGVTDHACVLVVQDRRTVQDIFIEGEITQLILGHSHKRIEDDGTTTEISRVPGRFGKDKRYRTISAIARLSADGSNLTIYHNPEAMHPLHWSQTAARFQKHKIVRETPKGPEWVKVG